MKHIINRILKPFQMLNHKVLILTSKIIYKPSIMIMQQYLLRWNKSKMKLVHPRQKWISNMINRGTQYCQIRVSRLAGRRRRMEMCRKVLDWLILIIWCP